MERAKTYFCTFDRNGKEDYFNEIEAIFIFLFSYGWIINKRV